MKHETTIWRPFSGAYWWTCDCGDEGGPYDYFAKRSGMPQ